MALKAKQKADIKEVFGDKTSTSLLLNLIALFPQLLKTVLELVEIWKERKKKPSVIMGGDDPKEPDPGTTPPAP